MFCRVVSKKDSGKAFGGGGGTYRVRTAPSSPFLRFVTFEARRHQRHQVVRDASSRSRAINKDPVPSWK